MSAADATRRALLAGALATAAFCAGAAPAGAAVRYAAPDSNVTSGACASTATACKLEGAIEQASSNDEVIVLPGTYLTGAAEIDAANAVTVRGINAANRPTIVGDPTAGAVLEAASGSVLRDLRVESRSDFNAISLQGATGERLIGIVSAGIGNAKGINLKQDDNVLRDSVAISDTPAGAALQIRDGTNVVIGVTAVGTNGAAGLRTKIGSGSATVKNSILSGAEDVDVESGGGGDDDDNSGPGGGDDDGGGGTFPTISWSNWRVTGANGAADGGNNQTAPASFCQTRDLYYPGPDSPTVDAGSADAAAGTTDVHGQARSLGAAHDIGAHEYDAAGCSSGSSGDGDGNGSTGGNAGGAAGGGTGGAGGGAGTGGGSDGPDGPGVLPPAAEPVFGVSVTLDEVRGALRVKLPGSDQFVPLADDSTVPVGAVVDATRGTVALTSVRDVSGATQTGTFWGGVFQVRQSRRDTVTELALTRGPAGGCAAKSAARRGKLSASRGRHSNVVRRLWGRDRGGRFRTRGRNGSATVRGTRWLTEDRCDGTRFKVTEGAIDVRDNHARRTVRLKRGQSYLARPHDPARKRGRSRRKR